MLLPSLTSFLMKKPNLGLSYALALNMERNCSIKNAINNKANYFVNIHFNSHNEPHHDICPIVYSLDEVNAFF